MPGMTGTDLADKVRAIRPEIGILLVTGYADPRRLPEGYPMLHKPFNRIDLAAKISEAARHRLN
jgi:FixJ family two-component response regulator